MAIVVDEPLPTSTMRPWKAAQLYLPCAAKVQGTCFINTLCVPQREIGYRHHFESEASPAVSITQCPYTNSRPFARARIWARGSAARRNAYAVASLASPYIQNCQTIRQHSCQRR